MSCIKVIPPQAASGRLELLYERVAGPAGQVDNVLQVHSLRPHTLEGHMALYKAVLHHASNHLPVWLLEAIGVLVSRINGCDYCARHHAAGLRRLLADGERADALEQALEADLPGAPFSPAEQAALAYAARLTRDPGAVGETDIEALRTAGFDDGEILEINQVAAYFAYANRTVSGLGVTTRGEVLGLSPGQGDDPGDWSHD